MASFEPRKKFIHKHNPRHTEEEAQHSGHGANQRYENCSLRKTAYPITQRNGYEQQSSKHGTGNHGRNLCPQFTLTHWQTSTIFPSGPR